MVHGTFGALIDQPAECRRRAFAQWALDLKGWYALGSDPEWRNSEDASILASDFRQGDRSYRKPRVLISQLESTHSTLSHRGEKVRRRKEMNLALLVSWCDSRQERSGQLVMHIFYEDAGRTHASNAAIQYMHCCPSRTPDAHNPRTLGGRRSREMTGTMARNGCCRGTDSDGSLRCGCGRPTEDVR